MRANYCMLLLCAGVGACGPGSRPREREQPVALQVDRVFFPGRRGTQRPGDVEAIRSLLNVHGRLRYGDFVWNEAGAGAGRAWVRIDLDRQLISVFRDGDEIGTAVILYGADKKPTPRGRFPVLARLKDHRSTLYDAVMPYTLRLTGDGVSIHGSKVRHGAATHGCVGIPTAFAAHLFGVMRVGDIVTIV